MSRVDRALLRWMLPAALVATAGAFIGLDVAMKARACRLGPALMAPADSRPVVVVNVSVSTPAAPVNAQRQMEADIAERRALIAAEKGVRK